MSTETTNPNDLAQAVLASGQTLAAHTGLSPNALKVIYATAVGHLEAERLEQAAAGAFQLVTLDPKSEDHWALYGNTLMKLGRFAEAVTAWEMAMVCAPRFTTAATIARTAIAIGKLDNASEALLMARSLHRTEAQAAEFDALIEAWYAARA
jgi:tetratricopeptide (TPR) repeat protein